MKTFQECPRWKGMFTAGSGVPLNAEIPPPSIQLAYRQPHPPRPPDLQTKAAVKTALKREWRKRDK